MKVAINNLICIIRTAAPSGAAGFMQKNFIKSLPCVRGGGCRRQTEGLVLTFYWIENSKKSSHFTLTRLSKKGII